MVRIARAMGLLALALLFGAIIGISFLALSSPVGYLAGYAGIIVVMILSMLVFVGVTVFVTRALCRDSRAKGISDAELASNNRFERSRDA